MSDFKILIVEDEVISGMLLKHILKIEGFYVTELVTTGEKAIESVKSNPPNLILMDIQLAGKISGIDAVIEIQIFSSIPVIFITGYDDIEIKNKALALNPAGFFNKPLFNNELIKKINEIKDK